MLHYLLVCFNLDIRLTWDHCWLAGDDPHDLNRYESE